MLSSNLEDKGIAGDVFILFYLLNNTWIICVTIYSWVALLSMCGLAYPDNWHYPVFPAAQEAGCCLVFSQGMGELILRENKLIFIFQKDCG